MSQLLLPTVLFLPFLGALGVLLVPREDEAVARGMGLVTSLVTFLLSLLLWLKFDPAVGDYQLLVDKGWVDRLGIRFKLGVDGISLWLVLLTTFLTPLALLSAQRAIHKKVKEFVAAFLLLETGMLGAFLALDLFLFYVMWEVMLVPMYFIIGIWGGERRVYASIKFVLFTLVGSLLMLVAIFYLYVKHGEVSGVYTFDLEALTQLQLDRTAQNYCFFAFALAFCIKIPLFPLHTWLPDAHVEAPTAGSVILAGVLLKLGIYGLIRFAMPLFPHASQVFLPYLVALSVIGIVYGAMVAYAQDDAKKLVAYSSVSHLGFCVLGLLALNPSGIQGSIFAMLSHGLTTGGLFLAIGILYERRHTRKLAEFGGLWATMPVFAAFFLIVTLGSAGLPGLSGFVGEFLSLLGAFTAPRQIPHGLLWPVLAATGVILGAVYLLTMFQKLMFGPLTNERNRGLPDLSLREFVVFLPVVLGIFGMGVYPRPFLKAMEPSVALFAERYHRKLSEPAEVTHMLATPRPVVPEGASRSPLPVPAREPGVAP